MDTQGQAKIKLDNRKKGKEIFILLRKLSTLASFYYVAVDIAMEEIPIIIGPCSQGIS